MKQIKNKIKSTEKQAPYASASLSPLGATGVLRVATECGCGPTKGSESPFAKEEREGAASPFRAGLGVSLFVLLCLLFASCNRGERTLSGLRKSDFATTVRGDSTALYVLRNAKDMEVCITNYGGRVVSIMVPDRTNKLIDVCLGHDSIADYLKYGNNFGALIGRYANRISHSRFTLDGEEYHLAANDNGTSLHGGGPIAFHNRVWQAQQPDGQHLVLTTISPDGEDGYPGELNVKVTYALSNDNALSIHYEATTTKPTVINLTNHCYFCLSGDPTRDILDEQLTLNADYYTPIDRNIVPTGAIGSVSGTPLEFRWGKAVGYDINRTDNLQIVYGRGYDHNFILNTAGDITKMAARLVDPHSGVSMEIYTTEPGIQFYSGNFLDGGIIGKRGIAYPLRSAFSFETQHYPDSPNIPHFPSTVLRPGETYNTTTIYKFSKEQ